MATSSNIYSIDSFFLGFVMIKFVILIALVIGIFLNIDIYTYSANQPSWIEGQVNVSLDHQDIQVRFLGKKLELTKPERYFPSHLIKEGDEYVYQSAAVEKLKFSLTRQAIQKGVGKVQVLLSGEWLEVGNVETIDRVGTYRLNIEWYAEKNDFKVVLNDPWYSFNVPFSGGELKIDLQGDLSLSNKVLRTLPIYLPLFALGAIFILLVGHRRIIILKSLKYEKTHGWLFGLVQLDKHYSRTIRDDWDYEERAKIVAKTVSWFMSYSFPVTFERQFKQGLFGENLLFRAEAYLMIGFFGTLLFLPLSIIWLFGGLG
jgi:hypothetical protein